MSARSSIVFTNTSIPNCEICGLACPVPLKSSNPYFRVVCCPACRHISVPEVTLNAEENQSIQRKYFGEAFTQRRDCFVALYEWINSRRTRSSLGSPCGQKLLEIGPGSGASLAYFASQGAEAIGLDVSATVASAIEKRYGLRVVIDELEDYAAKNGGDPYDIIVMRHVLEHFRSPLPALQAAFSILKPQGRIHIAVPNMNSWHRRWSGWSGYEPYHIHYFCESSLTAALRTAGFVVESVQTYESMTGWPNTIVRSLTNARVHPDVPSRQENIRYLRLTAEVGRLVLGLLISPLRWFQARNGWGEELIVIAAKPRK